MTPSVFFSTADIDAWIAEDAPLLDLTSHALELDTQPTRLSITCRDDVTAACTEEAARILTHCGGHTLNFVASGTAITADHCLIRAEGPAHALLRAWKVMQNLLEYACGVATATATMVTSVHQAAPDCAVLTTRKHPPGIKRIALKSALSGGALPHRLGLGETLLVFPQHQALICEQTTLRERLAAQGNRLCEKKLIIEAETLDTARTAIAAGADGIQFDKVAPEKLDSWCQRLRDDYPGLTLLAAGGIHSGNAARYARCGVDALVTSSLYQTPPADLSVQLTPAAES
ncbi:ModD protein [Vreelandella jeotgali]|uniref:ModD protein n=1 Tax=Vreelandella jeotgali TaxID=553386 RepID=UPI00034CABD7|nr:ModD protein [Halomonas jeotgali]